MPIRTKLTTKGFEEYLEKLVRMGRDVDKAAGNALHAGGQVLADGMKRRAPEKTGALKGAIGVSELKQNGNFVYVEVGILSTDADINRYGNVQEYGAADTPAQPYARPAIDEDMGKARRAMVEVIKEELLP